MPDINLTYYKPINRYQEEFHASKARHKLLIGGYGAGKSYPAIHESIFHCLQNPNHSFAVFRNTWDSVEDNIMDDFVSVCTAAGAVEQFNQTKHDLYLRNGCKVIFRPLSLGRKIFKGYHLCGFLIDDPDVNLHQDTISFLWSRLRNPPNATANRFQTIITANFEGRDWLWKTYINGREEGGDGDLAYWMIPTTANPTLHESFVKDLELMHSKEWVDRYVHCKMDAYTGIIYSALDYQKHHMDGGDMGGVVGSQKIMAVDVGIAHPTVVLKMVTDGKSIYVYDGISRRGWTSSNLGEYLVQQMNQENFHRIIIDPSSAKKEQTSGSSVMNDLRKQYRLSLSPANNDVNYGINLVQDLLQPASGTPRLFIDFHRCNFLVDEMATYRFEEPSNKDFDAMVYNERPDKKRGKDDACDTLRYGCCFLKKFLTDMRMGSELMQKKFEEHRIERFAKLKHLREHPERFEKFRLIETYRRQGVSRKQMHRFLVQAKNNRLN